MTNETELAPSNPYPQDHAYHDPWQEGYAAAAKYATSHLWDRPTPAPDSELGDDELPCKETQELVRHFAHQLSLKLAQSEKKYGWTTEWKRNDWMERCQDALVEHVVKGDPLDVAAYAAFCYFHNWPTALRTPSYAQALEDDERNSEEWKAGELSVDIAVKLHELGIAATEEQQYEIALSVIRALATIPREQSDA